jgi:hypothetical protein
MPNQAFAAALKILLFRAGPQDFPYSETLARAIVPLTGLIWFLQYRLTLPVQQAIVQAVASLAVLAAFSYFLLQKRGMLNRLRQTLDALYLCDALLTLAVLPPLSLIAPQMIRMAENPELARTESLPALPALAVMALSMWNFLVNAHVYRNALDTHFGVGALTALLSTMLTVSMATLISSLMS